MNKQLERITAFIESLPVENGLEDGQSVLLSTDMNLVGGDNGGNCINDLFEQCNKAENKGDCQNYNSACGKSTNKGSCYNTTLPRKPIGNDHGIHQP